jgi:hypothetical protein
MLVPMDVRDPGGAGTPRGAWYVRSPEGYPFVVFDYAGRRASHGFDGTKQPLFAQGLTYLGPVFERAVPPIDVEVEGRRETFYGFTADPRVWWIVDAFFRALEAGRFREGPS